MSEERLFSLRTDVALVPAGSPATRHILLTLTAPEAPRADSRGATVPGCPPARPSLHVSFVLDRSGSMGGSKIRLARDATVAVQPPSGARAEPLTRFEWCATDSGMRIALGDLFSRQELEVGIRIDLPAIPPGDAVNIRVALSDRDRRAPGDPLAPAEHPGAPRASTFTRRVCIGDHGHLHGQFVRQGLRRE